MISLTGWLESFGVDVTAGRKKKIEERPQRHQAAEVPVLKPLLPLPSVLSFCHFLDPPLKACVIKDKCLYSSATTSPVMTKLRFLGDPRLGVLSLDVRKNTVMPDSGSASVLILMCAKQCIQLLSATTSTDFPFLKSLQESRSFRHTLQHMKQQTQSVKFQCNKMEHVSRERQTPGSNAPLTCSRLPTDMVQTAMIFRKALVLELKRLW